VRTHAAMASTASSSAVVASLVRSMSCTCRHRSRASRAPWEPSQASERCLALHASSAASLMTTAVSMAPVGVGA